MGGKKKKSDNNVEVSKIFIGDSVQYLTSTPKAIAVPFSILSKMKVTRRGGETGGRGKGGGRTTNVSVLDFAVSFKFSL